MAIFHFPPTNGMRPKPIQPFYRVIAFMTEADFKKVARPVRHPSSEPVERNKKKKMSKSEMVKLARKRLRMLEELNTGVEEELVPLVTKEVDMGQFTNIEFNPMNMFIKESPGVSHDGVVVVDFDSV